MAVEACLDIANHIIAYEGYREPIDNKDAFQVLFERDILKMSQFRNVIVHDYYTNSTRNCICHSPKKHRRFIGIC